MDSIREWWVEERMKKAIEKLKAHEFKALCVKTKEEAAREIWKYITPDTRVGAGGSITIRELRILEPLRAKGNVVYDVWNAVLSQGESLQLRKNQMTSDLFLSSVNAVTMNGELVNIDGMGNRVNAMTFGPGKVILVVGYNKIVENVEEAIRRIKNVAAPMNAKRLNLDLPCANLGKCVDCNSPNRMCRILLIQEWKPTWTDILVILVREELGY